MNIAQIREKYPQYSDLSDKQLADALHAKFYSDLPITDFYKRIGFAPETTLGGQAKELVKGLIPGAVGLVEQAAVGASALLPQETEKAAREKIAGVAGAIKAPFAAAPGYEESVGRKLSEAIGSTVPFLLAGPFGLAGRAAAVGLGVGAGAGEARTRAEREGATEEQRATATALGIAPGALEAFAPLRILARIPDAATATGVQLVKRALVAGGEEAAQEAASNFAQNLIARGVYKPEQELIEGLGEAAAYGGATGAIVQGLMDLALGRRARGAQPAPGEVAGESPIDRAERLKAEAQPPAAPVVPPAEIPPAAEAPPALPAPEPAAEAPAEPAAAAAPAEEPISEPKVKKPGEVEPTGLQPTDIEALGISKKQPIYRRMLNKDMDDPAQREAVLADIENYLVKGHGSEESRAKLAEFKTKFEAPAPTPTPTPTPTETPSVPTATPIEQPSGAGAPVVSEPGAGAAPGGAGVAEPSGVVPPVTNVEQPAGGEGQQPAPVTPPAPTPVPPTQIKRELDALVESGRITEEQAAAYRDELLGETEEAPQTAMGQAFQKQIDDIKAQMNALRQKNGKLPAPKSKARAKYDELKAQLDALLPTETGTLTERLEKAGASGVVTSSNVVREAEKLEKQAADLEAKEGRVTPEVAGLRSQAASLREASAPVIDIPAIREALKNRDPKMLKAVLTYIGVDEDGNYLPTTYSADEAAESVGLKKSSGSNVRRSAESLGVTADVISRFHAAQTGAVGIAKNVSESGTGLTDVQPKAGILYERTKKSTKAVKFLRPALDEDGTLDFSKLDIRQLADIYSRASRYNAKDNAAVMQQLSAEVEARRKADRKGTDAAINRAYGKLVEEEEAQAETEAEAVEEAPEETETEDKTRRLSDEDINYRTVPQTPLVTDRISDAELRKVVADIGKALGGEVQVTVLDDVSDIDAKQKSGSRAGALVNGQIYLFRSGIAKGIEGQKTVFHELFHKGLKNLLPEAEYRALMSRFYNQSAEIRMMADAYLASDMGKKDTEGMSPQEARVLAVEESLAEVAEQTKLKPTLVRQVGNFLARVADRFGMPQLARAIRTMGLNEQQKFIQDALRAGLGPSAGEGATRFRTGDDGLLQSIGKFGPIEKASVYYWLDPTETSVIANIYDQDLIDSGVKPSKAVVDQFELFIPKDGKVAEIHTHGVSPSASAVLSKYKSQISRVKPVGFSRDAYYKFAPGSFSNTEIRNVIRKLRDIAVEEKLFDKVETVKIKRATGANAGRPPREISREAAMRFRTTPESKAAAEKVDAIGERKEDRFRDKVGRQLAGNKALRLREKFTDSMAPMEAFFVDAFGGAIRSASGRLNPMVLLSRALDALRVSKAVQAEGGLFMKDGLLVAGDLKDADGRSVSYKGVLESIASAARSEKTDFNTYRKTIDNILYGHREFNLRKKRNEIEQQAQALEAAGKTNEAKKLREEKVDLLLDDAQIDAAEDAFQKDKFIQGILKDLDLVRFNLLDRLVEVGRISKEQAQDYKDALGYIPFKRIGDYENAWNGATRGANRGAAAFKNRRSLEGSSRQSESVIENFSGLVDWATKEAMKNHAVSNALDVMETLKAAKPGEAPYSDSPGGEVVFYKDGVPTKYYVPDPAHLATFSMADPQLSNIVKALSLATRTLRAGVTSMPPFAVKQIFDDIVRAYAYAGVKNNGELVKNILFNFPKNWVNEMRGRKTAEVRNLERLGIVGTFDVTTHTNLKDILKESGAEKETLGQTILRVMEAGAKASDVSVREAIYKQVLKETGDAAQAESAAREIINFSRRGSSKMMNQMISVIPFFNAYARGMDKLATAAAGKMVGQTTGTARSMFYKRMGVMTAMGMAYALMMQDDEEYQALPDHVRDTNWILPGGRYLGFAPGIPVPAELAFFFKAIPERVLRYYKYQGTEDEQAAVEVLGQLAKRGFDVFSSPNLLAQGIRPLVENAFNYSFFLGRPLESQSQLKLEPFERYGTGTSDAMKALAVVLEDVSNATGMPAFAISPIKLENAIRGIFGTAAGVALTMADAMVNPDRTDRPLHQQLAPQLTGASALMKNPVGTRYMDEIYALEDKTERAYNTYNKIVQTDPDKAAKYLEDNIGMYAIRDSVRAVMQSIRTLNEASRMIDRDTSMSPEERRKAVDELRAEQNEIARTVFMLRREARNIQLGL
jgi:polyhydroxyalkanoate synthesis regulator phasin